MRLNDVLKLPAFKECDIALIGTLKTSAAEYCVLARSNEKVFPVPRLFHLVENGPENRNPDIDEVEIRSILSRFHYFEDISRFSSK